jgi:hypothetical protein
MAAPTFLKCDCSHCGGHIEFPADGIGNTIPCPHCGADTELTLPAPDIALPGYSSSLKWAMAGLIILVLGVLGVFIALNLAQRILRNPPTIEGVKQRSEPAGLPASPESQWLVHSNHFTSSKVTIEAQPGSTLVYALGTLKNQIETQRFGVTVELDLFDATGRKIGTAQDYREIIEGRGEWKFRALLVIPNVAAAQVRSIRDQP